MARPDKTEATDMQEDARAEAHDTRGHLLMLGMLCLVGPAILLAKLNVFALNFPYWDAWRIASLLELSDAGQLQWADIWAQHNEHRIVFPKLLMLTLARLSGWNVAWEIGASVVFATVILGCIGVLLWRALRGGDVALRTAGLAMCAALIFSWSQNENWVWGFQHNVWMAMAAFYGAVLVLAREGRLAPRVLPAAGLALVSSLSYANGLLAWVALLPLVWDLRRPLAERRSGAVVWGLLAAALYSVYFIGYTQPAVSPPLTTALQHPLLFVRFFVVMIGAPISACFTSPAWHGVDALPPWWAYLPGPLALGGLALLLLRQGRDRSQWSALAPWVVLVLFALGSAAVASAGRCGFGLGQALTSRYITVTTPLWIALVVLTLRMLQHDPRWAGAQRRAFAVGVSAAAALAVLGGAATHSRDHEQRCHWKRMGWLAIQLGAPHPLFLRDLSDQPEALGQQILPWLAQTRRCGLGATVANAEREAPRFVREAARLVDLGLLPQAEIYLGVAATLAPNLPEIAPLREAISAKRKATAAGSAR